MAQKPSPRLETTDIVAPELAEGVPLTDNSDEQAVPDDTAPEPLISRGSRARLLAISAGGAVLVIVLGVVLKTWVSENQPTVLEQYAEESEENQALARQPSQVSVLYRALAARTVKTPLQFLHFGTLVIQHRNCFRDDAPDPASIEKLESLLSQITGGKFDPVEFTRSQHESKPK